MTKEHVKIHVISLGCDKNRVDTENMLYYISKGIDCEVTADISDADIIIINTCAFINSARKESIETILDAARYKQKNCEKLIVTGCLPQRYLNEITAQLPEVDAFLGTNDYDKIIDAIKSGDRFSSRMGGYNDNPGRILSTNDYAYLKIAEGCNNNCMFCTIPKIRGPYKSRTMDSLLKEADSLIDMGVKEIILVAQDITKYGEDLYGKNRLCELLEKLAEKDVVWIRPMYCYPENVTDDLIELIASQPKITKYIDVPVQHVSDKILKTMNRKTDKQTITSLFEKLNKKNIAIRTTFMVGFPGETQEDFEELCAFVEQFKPLNAGVFAYSREEDSPSYKLKDQIPYREKMKRRKILGELIYKNIKILNQNKVGDIVKVLYEGIDFDKNLFYGRSQFNAPDVDGKIYFKGTRAEAGHFYDVKITGAAGYDLIGKIIEK